MEILDLVPFVRFTPTPTSLPKQVLYVQCAAERSTWRTESGLLSLPLSLIRPLPQAAHVLGRVGRLPPKNFYSFRRKTPEPPRPSPIVGVGETKALPAPN